METTQKIEMLESLDNYLKTKNSIKITKTDDSVLIGNVIDYNKGIAAELFIDPKTGQAFDSPEIILELFLKVDSSDNYIKIGFKDILRFEPNE